ncbi:MAG TPA: FAD-linked oxidase C-terminal domain-containing protein [Pyrinomonadaceae bacterium]|nr:FAD-linked oxidase C-terminal domain-containing protein [Pyrinomonadaceae bacterium]
MAASTAQLETHDALVEELREIVGEENVLSEPDELLVYECDGLPQHKHPPRAVVFPNSTEETSDVLQLLAGEGVSFAPRGAGTGLSGGALAINRGVVIEIARMRRILRVDPENRIAVVQTGLVNAHLSRAVAPYGLYYVPDPSSQPSCTIGGNIAENAGGIHCLKYGTTTDHVIGARVVLSDGAIVDLVGGAVGYDLLGVFVGSEGTFGIATEATVKLSPIPPAVRTLLADFSDVDRASHAVSAIIAAGVLPAALEMMDNAIIRAVEASVFTAGLPIDAQAVLLVELDGVEAGIDEDAEKVEAILRERGARSVHSATDQNERKKLWAARKGAFGAVGRLSPDIMIQDAVVPRSHLPEVLAETYRIAAHYNLQLANVFHAGDGNLHPLICFDLRRGDDLEHVRQAGREIMETCVRAGGSITGEHGVGLDKSAYLPLIFSEDDMDAMLRVRAAFDPSGLCNPGKIIPLPRGCGEARAVATQSLSEPGAVQGEGLSNARPIPHPSPLPTGAEVFTPSRLGPKTATAARLAERISEARIANEFKRIVGALNVNRLVETDLAAKFQTNTAETERTLSVAPATAGEAREVTKLAAREGLALIPAGTASWRDVGNPLSRMDLILSTHRMTKIIRHEPADLVATAEAGTTLVEFQKQLANAGQWLPIDPPDDGHATLGGVVATGLGGAQGFGYGLPRSFVIGMRVVLADGRSIKAGGNVVKNVAGYDLCKLFCGSYGTLGLITELTFKLRPRPAETRTIIATGSLASLLAAGRAVISGSLFPVAVELLSSRMADHLKVGGRPRDFALLVRFAGASRSVVSETAQALKLVRSDRDSRARTLDEDERLWSGLAAVTLRLADNLSWRASLRPGDLVSFVNEVAALETDEASHPSLMWHAGVGDGRLRAIAKPPVYHREAVRALERLRQKAETLSGNLVVESAPIEIKNEFDAWGGFGSAAELMARVKSALDPQNLLSPGRFEGVI